jgi:hypothetical protein
MPAYRGLRAWDAGMDAEAVAAKYDVSRAWVHHFVERRRETGRSLPGAQTKFRRRALEGHEDRLVASIAARPDATLAELHDALLPTTAALGTRRPGCAGGVSMGHQQAHVLAYVEQILVPTLRPCDVVVLDNWASTNSRQFATRSNGPGPTSASCGPIASDVKGFAKLKAFLRAARLRSLEDVCTLLRTALGLLRAPNAATTCGTAAIASLRPYEKRSSYLRACALQARAGLLWMPLES